MESVSHLVPGSDVVDPTALAMWSGTATLAARRVEVVDVFFDLRDGHPTHRIAGERYPPPSWAPLKIAEI